MLSCNSLQPTSRIDPVAADDARGGAGRRANSREKFPKYGRRLLNAEHLRRTRRTCTSSDRTVPIKVIHFPEIRKRSKK